jgi:hypothetical protein
LSYNPLLGSPWEEISAELNKKYHVLDTVSLDDYWYMMGSLYERLLPFKSKAFGPNEKIICYFFDTEFVLNNTGFNLYNFQLVLSKLDIAQSSIIFLTSHYGIENTVHRLGKDLCNDSWPMTVVCTSYVQILSNPEAAQLESPCIENIEYPYVCLNGVQRTHRLMLLCCLEDLNILNNGIVTWNFYQNNKTSLLTVSKENKSNEQVFLTTNPPTRINDTVFWDDSLRTVYKKHHNKFYNQTNSTRIIEPYKTSCTVEDHILKSFLCVVTETVFDYPYCFITEKTFKTFLNKRPFVILGPPGTLKQIKQLGFKTFDTIIDESYDEIVDPSARLIKVVKIIESISQLSIDEIKKIMLDIQPILDFNHNHYHNNYCRIDLKRTLSIL